MKILTPIKTAITAFPQKERRDALAQFLIRYSNKNTKLTHYRCIGYDADIIVKYLIESGFTSKVDFEVITSELDSSVKQIRWKRNSSILREWLNALINLNITPNILFNIISNKKFSDNDLPETLANEANQDVQTETVNTTNDISKHFSQRVQQTTTDIMEWLATTKKDLLDYLPRNYREFELTKSSAPNIHMLPIALIELFATEKGLLKNIPTENLPPCPIFSLHINNMTAVRYMNKLDSLDFTAGLFDAPAKAYLYPDTDNHNEVNPLKGFLLNTWNEVYLNINEKPTSSDLFVLTSGIINTIDVPAATALAISEFTSDPKNFWKYVTTLYEVVYGLRCSLVPRSRIGVYNSSRLSPSAAYMGICDNEYACPFNSLKDSSLANNLCMIAAVVLSDKEPQTANFTPFQDTIQSNKGILATEFRSVETNLEVQAPSKKDIPVTWLAAFQVDPNQVSEGFTQPLQNNYLSFVHRTQSLESQYDCMNKIRKISEHANLAELSAIVPDNSNEISGPTNKAFIMNIASILTQQDQITENPPSIKHWEGNGTGHDSNLFITNVYTGVTTDKSPSLTTENLEYFPDLKEYIKFIHDSYHSLNNQEENQMVKTFTSFIEGLSSDKAKLQLSMAQRTVDTTRRYTVIVETNFDFNYVNNILNTRLSTKLKKALIQAIAFRNDSYVATISNYYATTNYPHIDAIQKEYCEYTHKEFYDRITFARDVRNNSDIYNDQIISIDIVPDKYGRTYLIYSVSASLAAYIMTIYRFITGAPVFTRNAIASTLHQSQFTSEELTNVSRDIVDKYTRNVIRQQVLMHTNNNWECVTYAGLSARKLLYVWTPAYTSRCLAEVHINYHSFTRDYLLTSLYRYNSNVCLNETTVDWSKNIASTIQEISG